MRTPIAIIAAGLLIAAAIVFVFRWQISAAANEGGVIVYRLDRWTGEIIACIALLPCRPIDRGR
jgi:hypothetical protein